MVAFYGVLLVCARIRVSPATIGCNCPKLSAVNRIAYCRQVGVH